MAKATSQTQNDQLPATTNPSALATQDDLPDFAADAGQGMEEADSDSYAIPFLVVLQKGSPQVDEASGAAIEGAKSGMIYDNVSGRLFDGKKGVLLVPCHYRRVFLRWGPRGTAGGKFRGELKPEQVAQMRLQGTIKELENRLYVPNPDGSVSDKTCDRIADVRNHYVLLVDEETGAWTSALLSLGSTQIKKSKSLMTLIDGVKVPGNPNLVASSYASVVRMTTLPEQNEKGTWHGVKFERVGWNQRKELYAAGKAFHEAVKRGAVEAKYEETDDVSGGGSNVPPDDNRI